MNNSRIRHDAWIHVKVPSELLAVVDRAAEKEGRTRSSMVRQLIQRALLRTKKEVAHVAS